MTNVNNLVCALLVFVDARCDHPTGLLVDGFILQATRGV